MTGARWFVLSLAGGAALRLADAAPLPVFALPGTSLVTFVLFAHFVARRLSPRPLPSSLPQGLVAAGLIALPFVPAIIRPEGGRDAIFGATIVLVCPGALLLILYPHAPVRALLVGWRQAFSRQPAGVNHYRLAALALGLMPSVALWLGGRAAGATLAALVLSALVLLTLRFTGYVDTSEAPRSDGAAWPVVLSVALAVLVLPVFRLAPLPWVWLPAGLLACGAVFAMKAPAICAPLATLLASVADTASVIAPESLVTAVPMVMTHAAKATLPVLLMALSMSRTLRWFSQGAR